MEEIREVLVGWGIQVLEQIEEVSIDLWSPYKNLVEELMPNANFLFSACSPKHYENTTQRYLYNPHSALQNVLSAFSRKILNNGQNLKY